MAVQYDVGDVGRITCTFTDSASGNPVDPGQVRVKVLDPTGILKTYVYNTDPEVVRTSQGNYRIDVFFDKASAPGPPRRDWCIRFEGKVSNRSAEETHIVVRESCFYKQTGVETPNNP